MPQKSRRRPRAGKQYKLSTAQPLHEVTFEEFPEGICAHTAKTATGTLAYMYVREQMRRKLWALSARFQLGARAGGPVDFDEIARRVGAAPSEITVEVDQAFADEAEECAQHALGLLDRIAPQLLVHASEQLVFEVFYRTICDRRGRGSYRFLASEAELLKLFSEHVVRRLRQRVTPRKRPSRKLEWTPERCEEYLVTYERTLDTLQRAKAICQRNSDDEWQKMVTAVFPDLPSGYYARLQLRGDGEPHDMAREYAAEL
jgi:hypothetical protein